MASTRFDGINHGLQIGNNHGSITAEFHLPLERPETPPNPVSTVPFRRDPDFVSRDTLLDLINEKSSVPGSRIALVGLGGVGKSQLAIEYSYRIRDRSPERWVFWVHASNAARFEQSLREIADYVKIPGRQDPNANIFKLVQSWLRDKRQRKWTLILDNIDDYWFVNEAQPRGQEGLTNGRISDSARPLLEFLPRSSNGSIIITTRTTEVALKLVNHQDLIKIEPMARSEALELLQKKLEPIDTTDELPKLVEALEFMPMAIAQAAAYIKHRAPRYSVSQYLDMFRKSDSAAIRLLDYEAGHLYRDWEAKNAILVTWQISFGHIRRIRPSAVDLLSLMSFYDRHAIPENLLRVQSGSKNDYSNSEKVVHSSSDEDMDTASTASESETYYDFEDDIATLRDYSFISVGEDRTVFSMHRLVQLTVRMWLKTYGQMELWKERFINNLCQEFPTSDYENWKTCRSLFPHVKSALFQRPESQECLRKWATLLYRGAQYAWRSGNIAEVEKLASKSRAHRVRILGEAHEEALKSTELLGIAYTLEGRWDDAEKLQVQVMKTRKTELGEEHPDTLKSMVNLGVTYIRQDRLKEAEKLLVQAMEIRKSKLGEDHSDTVWSMANVAGLFQALCRWEEAEKLGVQVIKAYKTKFGEDHPDTLTVASNLGAQYAMQGRWEEAEKLEVQVLEIRKTKLGDDHPDTLLSMYNLASMYMDQSQWEEAEKLEVQVVESRKTKLGEDHPDTLLSMESLALIYKEQGRWEEAERLEVQVMETRKTKLGEYHPDVLASMANLAATYREQGRWEETERLEVQLMETRKSKLGKDHSDTLSSMANLALTYWNQNQWEKAQTLEEQGQWEEAENLEVLVIETRKTKLSEDHPDALRSMANLAAIYREQGRWEEAEHLSVQVLKMTKSRLGEDHLDRLECMNNLAMTYWKQGRWEKAENLEVQVLETRKTKLGEYHPDTLTSLANLSFIWKSSGKTADAINLLRECLAKQRHTIGPNHPHAASNSETLLVWEAEELNIIE
ncbi:hypothetical protein TCE0_044f16170 [Talaromyces pinophilus]|uniref:DUF7779 domain-containing protein n=1 Tax=Talaromyces pinophilus TaxID=128442 RepID=A0A478EAD0_TALPI|nr:hypothetical protein TCE0_044f16170 [Talaromyces pinophilus]